MATAQELGVNVDFDRLPVFSMADVPVLATASAAEANRWMATHVYNGDTPKVPFVGFDTEWSHRPGVGFGVAVLQLATLKACLVFSVAKATDLPAGLATAIKDPQLAKVVRRPGQPYPLASHAQADEIAAVCVLCGCARCQVGVSLDQDIQYVELQFGIECAAMADLSVDAERLGFGSSAGTRYAHTRGSGAPGPCARRLTWSHLHGHLVFAASCPVP